MHESSIMSSLLAEKYQAMFPGPEDHALPLRSHIDRLDHVPESVLHTLPALMTAKESLGEMALTDHGKYHKVPPHIVPEQRHGASQMIMNDDQRAGS